MDSNNEEPKKISYAYKYWISFEVRNTHTDRSRRFNTTIILTRKPKNESDVVMIEQILKKKILETTMKGMDFSEKNTLITLLAWPHSIEKVNMKDLPQLQPKTQEPKKTHKSEKLKPKLTLLPGGKDTTQN